jgi:DNA-damage-inducible protein D
MKKRKEVMNTEEIKQLFESFEFAASYIEDVECWSAREMQSLLGCNIGIKFY